MVTINPYLNFEGNTEEAFKFYRSVFGGDFSRLQRFKGVPGTEKLSPQESEKIMHVSLPIGKHNLLMGTDALESMGHKLIPGNNFSLLISTESKEEAKKIFDGLASGGKIEMPLADAFWGAYFGMLQDKFGIHWMVSYEYN
ncbi:MAG TPA: VOC family protein [Terriglobales bacterium]|nr:VOC family protein [Terriglobales bacterium]